ncbi:hypothetical protein F5884DRAFT_743934 [Xylogone sp. PMI_703]|nr:hypothetical protein F5884DRAFT_743934 [Xylogone sp. PMI_703]
MTLILGRDPEMMPMENHSFDLARVKQLLSSKCSSYLICFYPTDLDISISKVKYGDIASHVGLDPMKAGRDIETFDMYQARLPNDIFSEIVKDVEMFAMQYGTLDMHRSEEAKARYLSSYFNRIVAMFGGLLLNTPEAMIEGRFTEKGRIEYQFRIFQGVAVIFIEVKPQLGSYMERLDYIAQVIAEAKACSLMNYKDGFYVPILGILCVGDSFQFFQYTHSRGSQETKPSFKIGKFLDDRTSIRLEEPELAFSVDTKEQIRQLRSICESMYYVFLKAYTNGLDAHWIISKQRGKSEGQEWDSTTEWLDARARADETD